jgi:ketosteroid isomerase-like protein
MKPVSFMIKIFAIAVLLVIMGSCQNNNDSFTSAQRSVVEDSVRQMLASVAKAIADEGPIAWLRYFENSPDFFMAADGQLAFANNDSATNFLKNTYAKSIGKIELRWDHVRIDPLTGQLAGVAAVFHEDITDTTGKKMPSDGYFTGIAHQTAQGWQLRNAHWSIMHIKKD